jgi:2-polyprenyl-3-methyl-5-hydroxy-6-metoxy-1,4-benzoquinol methylase
MPDQVSGLLSSWLREKRLEVVRQYLSGRVLDFGCGVGSLACYCEPDMYLGVDVDDTSTSIARRRFPRHSFSRTVDPSDSFDTIVALAVIEHVADPLALLRMLRGMLNRRGIIVLTTPHPRFEWIHTAGARLHLFSCEAADEHQVLLDRVSVEALCTQLPLRLALYRRFLLGANQLFVLTGEPL